MCRPRRAVRQGVRRQLGHPQFWWSPCQPNLLCQGANRATAPLWRLSSHDATGGAWPYSPSYSPGCTGTHHRGWRRSRCRSASPTGWRARDLHGEHGGALYRRVQQRLLSLDKCTQIQCECDLARSLQGCFLCQSLFHTDPSHLYSQWRCIPKQIDIDERKPAERWSHLVTNAGWGQTSSSGDT